jgi:hypothetical protein
MRYARLSASIVVLLVLYPVPGQTQEKKAGGKGYTSEYYPLHVGNEWIYKATFGDAPPKDTPAAKVPKVVVTVDQQESYEYKFIRDKKEGKETIARFRLKLVSESKSLFEHVAVLEDGVYRFTSADKDLTPPLRILMFPISRDGETWTVDSMSQNVQLKGTFICHADAVKVPAGQFEALRVSCKDFQIGTEKQMLDVWFARNVGVVKLDTRVGNSRSLLELEKFTEGK